MTSDRPRAVKYTAEITLFNILLNHQWTAVTRRRFTDCCIVVANNAMNGAPLRVKMYRCVLFTIEIDEVVTVVTWSRCLPLARPTA